MLVRKVPATCPECWKLSRRVCDIGSQGPSNEIATAGAAQPTANIPDKTLTVSPAEHASMTPDGA